MSQAKTKGFQTSYVLNSAGESRRSYLILEWCLGMYKQVVLLFFKVFFIKKYIKLKIYFNINILK